MTQSDTAEAPLNVDSKDYTKYISSKSSECMMMKNIKKCFDIDDQTSCAIRSIVRSKLYDQPDAVDLFLRCGPQRFRKQARHSKSLSNTMTDTQRWLADHGMYDKFFGSGNTKVPDAAKKEAIRGIVSKRRIRPRKPPRKRR
jgi:hypothetical protein